ncbi:hypothetical protein HanPSC8_Chr05g0225291 [Helianthus annuus]|nr:hypothetical protein HanPSC8_Chr05g0225291 [Helianthus annuus]
MDLHGHDAEFKDGLRKVIKRNLVVASGKNRCSMYLVKIPSKGMVIPVLNQNKF